MLDVTTVRFNPVSLFVTVTLALAIRAPVPSVTKPVMAPVGTCAQTIPRVARANARSKRLRFFMYGSPIGTVTVGAPANHKTRLKTRIDSRRGGHRQPEPWLTGLVEPDAPDQVRKTRIAAQGIKVGVHFEQSQNV